MQRGLVLWRDPAFRRSEGQSGPGAADTRTGRWRRPARGRHAQQPEPRHAWACAIGAVRMRNCVAPKRCLPAAATPDGRRWSTTIAAPSRHSAATCRPRCPPSMRPPSGTERPVCIPGLLSVERAEALLGVRLIAEARQAARTRGAASLPSGATRSTSSRPAFSWPRRHCWTTTPAVALVEAELARRSAQRQGRQRWAALAGYLRLLARWREGDRERVEPQRWRTRIATELAEAGWVVQ